MNSCSEGEFGLLGVPAAQHCERPPPRVPRVECMCTWR